MKHRYGTAFVAVFMAVMMIGLFGACGGGGGKDTEYVYVGDDPADGTMSFSTADNIFFLEEVPAGDRAVNGVRGYKITGVKSALQLAAYLNREPAAARVAVTFELEPKPFTIPVISGSPVVGIGDGGLGSTESDKSDDISVFVNVVVLPTTIETLGTDLFAGIQRGIELEVPKEVLENPNIPAITVETLKEAAGDKATVVTIEKDESGTVVKETVVEGPPVLQNITAPVYTSGAAIVTYTFDIPVTADSVTDWAVTVADKVVTATYNGPGTDSEQVTNTLTVKNFNDVTKTVTVSAEAWPIAASFARPNSDTQYKVRRYVGEDKVARLTTTADGVSKWYYVGDESFRKIFNAIYSPNAPASTDSLLSSEGNKSTIPYTATISETVLDLFTLTIGANQSDDKIEIKGTVLPTADGASPTNLIVIDIGIPEVDNAYLPKFLIPWITGGSFGANGGLYSHVRLRVNNGASLVVEADNSGFATGTSAPNGNFTGGCVEVMAGGKLRDGAFQGYPLGTDTVILSRYNSYLAVGPEAGHEGNTWWSGWLIGPSGTTPTARIQWEGSGNSSSNYIEVRPGLLAVDAKVSVRKPIGLIYDAWFVGNSTVIVGVNDTATTDPAGAFRKGMWSNGNFTFYGIPDAKITVESGSFLDENFFGTNNVIYGPKTITATTNGTMAEYPEAGGPIKGYSDWSITTP